MMTRPYILFTALLAAAVPVGAIAAADPAPPPRAELFEALARCRSVTDAAARLQCFDTATANLEAAVARRDIVVVDRAQVREGRRRLFGLSLPSLPIFGGGDDEPEQERVTSLEGVIAGAGRNANGQWIITLRDGSVWTQVDSNTLALEPRAGQPIVINRGVMGSYMMRVNNQPGLRARRVR